MRRLVTHTKNTAKKFWATLTLMSVELIVVLILFVLSFFVFVFIARRIFWQKKDEFDYAVFNFMKPLISELRTDAMEFFTFLGTHTFLIPMNLLLIGYFLFIKPHRWYSITIPVVSLGGVSLMFILKNLFGRPRPDDPLLRTVSGLSFPSGHALISVAFYGLLIYLVWHNITNKFVRWMLIVLLLILILIIGLSRIYLRVHYASDVLAGFAMGTVWLILSIWVVRKIERFTRKEIAPVIEEQIITA
jgi:membrane-associated phospholipid phosphatase